MNVEREKKRTLIQHALENFDALQKSLAPLTIPIAQRKLMRALAQQGDNDARCALAVVHLFASRPRQLKRAYQLLLAMENHPLARVLLGCILDAGLVDSRRQPNAAAKMFQDAYHQSGHPVARRRLALKLHWGDGVRRHPQRAGKLWKEGANSNDPVCMFHLGMAYSEGLGVRRDHRRAAKWMRGAAAEGSQIALRQLSDWCWSGEVVRRNRPAAIRGYLALARQGLPSYITQRLGLAYEIGIGVQVDANAALRWYRRAIRLGDYEVWNDIGYMYLNGTCVPLDAKRARAYFQQAAARGSVSGLYNLGETYAVLKQYERAIDYYQVACDRGHPRAPKALEKIKRSVPRNNGPLAPTSSRRTAPLRARSGR